jgi:hypothetical protein
MGRERECERKGVAREGEGERRRGERLISWRNQHSQPLLMTRRTGKKSSETLDVGSRSPTYSILPHIINLHMYALDFVPDHRVLTINN